MKKTYLSNPAPGENLLSGNLVMETGCRLLSIRSFLFACSCRAGLCRFYLSIYLSLSLSISLSLYIYIYIICIISGSKPGELAPIAPAAQVCMIATCGRRKGLIGARLRRCAGFTTISTTYVSEHHNTSLTFLLHRYLVILFQVNL